MADAKTKVSGLSPVFVSKPLANWFNAGTIPEKLIGTIWLVPESGWTEKSILSRAPNNVPMTRSDIDPSQLPDKQETLVSLKYSSELGAFGFLTGGLEGEDLTHTILQVPVVLSLTEKKRDELLKYAMQLQASGFATPGHRLVVITEVRLIVGSYRRFRSSVGKTEFSGWGVRVGGKVLSSQEDTNIVSQVGFSFDPVPLIPKEALESALIAIQKEYEAAQSRPQKMTPEEEETYIVAIKSLKLQLAERHVDDAQLLRNFLKASSDAAAKVPNVENR